MLFLPAAAARMKWHEKTGVYRITMQGTAPAVQRHGRSVSLEQFQRMIHWPAAGVPHVATWSIAAAATAAVIVRPGR